MVLVYLNTGECIEVEPAVRVAVEDELFVCYTPENEAVATFPRLEVQTYTANEGVAEQLKEEVCEDLTVVSEGEAPEQRV